jgi:8-oxo-dGTP pyrophosphatase MutT (NUDIX family)
MPEDLQDEPVQVEIVSTQTVYRGNVWNIDKDQFRLGAHSISREYMSHTGAVAILALDESDRALLIKQYRHPIRMRDWEIPAGLLDFEGESPLAAAQRELAEEADLVANRWDLLGEFASTPGGSNEVIRVYLARDVTAAPEVFERTEEEAEIEKRWVPLDEVVDAVLSRDLQNSILMIAALSAQASRARGWTTLGDPNAAWPRHPLERR